ncbi:hypothetical protein DDZ14_16095 [Maritimibacter sp. 55A14]|uniref:hypothetical protein n=1 Tax=Maritimibacter sp. 55A14 TaxID=2174844 RepID=UPI000D6213F3|nr:hypothetical protein [Maritimibacter sp. 55A14]PWE29962.1 hypothetical protein DDZ14_16095 [Maritimibacter sp. 55A14]
MTALAYPLSLAEFMDRLLISSAPFDLPEQVEIAGTAGGEILKSEIAARLWTGSVRLGRMTAEEARPIRARINLLRSAGASFLAYDPKRAFPAGDPGGTILGAATPVIDTLDADARLIALGGLPVGYVLAAGDMLSFQYGTNPVRYALHEVVEDSATADGTGVTPLFEVRPAIRPGAVTGTAVALTWAHCKATLVPGEIEVGTTRRTITEGVAFRFIQTLR